MGLGGIASAEDVLEFILAGAHMVQIGTSNYVNPNIGVDILQELEDYCKENGLKNILELKGQLNS